MKYHFRNLVFEGGGVKGIAYVGALSVLQEKGILENIVRVGGTSAGAIIAAMVALDYTIDEMQKILWTMDFRKFLDSSWGVIRNTDRLIKEFGWYKGDAFYAWISQIIEKKTGKPDTTFQELKNLKLSRELYLIGTNLSTGFAEIFSYLNTPTMPVAEAVRISMSIPLFFTAVRNQKQDVCVDGGVLDNYPIKLFDRRSFIDSHYQSTHYYEKFNKAENLDPSDAYVFNMETLGFRLDSSKEITIFEGLESPQGLEIKDFYGYLKRLVGTMLDSQQNRHLHSDDWQRTIYIDSLGVRTTDFDITNELKKALITSGRENSDKYFKWFEESKRDIANKPRSFYDSID